MTGRIWMTVVHDDRRKSTHERVDPTVTQARDFAKTSATLGHVVELYSVRLQGEPREVLARLAAEGLTDEPRRAWEVEITRRLVEKFIPRTELIFPKGAWAFDHIQGIPEEVDDGS